MVHSCECIAAVISLAPLFVGGSYRCENVLLPDDGYISDVSVVRVRIEDWKRTVKLMPVAALTTLHFMCSKA